MSNAISRLDGEFPGFARFVDTLWSHFALGAQLSVMRRRIARSLEPELDRWRGHLEEWRKQGILDNVDRDEQVGFLWQDPLFHRIFHDAIGFAPPEDCDLREFTPPQPRSVEDLCKHRRYMINHIIQGSMTFGREPYWKLVLWHQAPLLYLEPFLRPGPLLGCDLAAGWGRACLTLPEYKDRTILALDLSQDGLDRLKRLAENCGLQDRVLPTRADLSELPFEADKFDFFLAFDIFEHMTDALLEKVLLEILRCGRSGAPLYAEIPLFQENYALTHLQNFTTEDVLARFDRIRGHGKAFKLLFHDARVPELFTFQVV